jgi:hypothetical protein
MVRVIIVVGLLLNLMQYSFSGEGMWMPLWLDSLNHKDMQEKGLRLSAEEIYSINQPSLKDAVVMFGNGCTAGVISPEGLIITNHHCGYSRITDHSTVENNYLADGFWAGSTSEELVNPGLTVTFLVRMEDVTSLVTANIPDTLSEMERTHLVSGNIYAIINKTIRNTHYQAEVKPFHFGKEYYLFVYEIFKDVRLVGAPPESIGNFGRDTDNWIWPRHTGDFTLFRIYAGKDNQPADYSPENVPYKPKRHLNISGKGVEEDDFTMVMGYPFRTDQYLTSDALQMISLKSLPAKIEMRTVRLNTLQDIMDRGTEQKLRYASKYRTISNSWKKWMGVTSGIVRADVIERKKHLEKEFTGWASELKSDSAGYAGLMENFTETYAGYEPLYLSNDIGGELLNSIELSTLVNSVQIKVFSMSDSSENYKRSVNQLLHKTGSSFYKTAALEIDRKTLPVLLETYADYIDERYIPDFYRTIRETHQGDYHAFVDELFAKSMFTDSLRFFRVIRKPEKAIRKKIINDPLITIYRDFAGVLLSDSFEKLDSFDYELRHLYRKYITGLMSMKPSGNLYPDANFTMRITYGKVTGYQPADAVRYSWYSTLDGIMEKENPEISDYQIHKRLKALHASKDFGSYAENGSVPVCFIASNHTSGGNSGSPVLDADGNLIGINFDRNWEGTVSDYAYDPEVCRNISLDIRYVLFIIDKFADADWLLEELTIINN